MRTVLILATALLGGCDYGFKFHSAEMTPDEMLQRADLIFIGVIEGQHLDSWPFFRVPGPSPDADGRDMWFWRPLRRRVRVETVLRGSYAQKDIDVYEIHWIGASSGNWNATHDHERDLFLVRRENGRWHIVRDYWRSIYPANNGYHGRLPMDASRSFWERYALTNYWIGSDQEGSYGMFRYEDPGGKLGWWRKVKLLRGLLRHPQRTVRRAACDQLIFAGSENDECLSTLSESDFRDNGSSSIPLGSPTKWDADGEKVMRSYFEWSLLPRVFPSPIHATLPSCWMNLAF